MTGSLALSSLWWTHNVCWWSTQHAACQLLKIDNGRTAVLKGNPVLVKTGLPSIVLVPFYHHHQPSSSVSQSAKCFDWDFWVLISLNSTQRFKNWLDIVI